MKRNISERFFFNSFINQHLNDFDELKWLNNIYYFSTNNNITMDRDILHPTLESERQAHKLKRLVQSPNSYFMDVKCGGCN